MAERFFFLHLHKTGGTALWKRMKAAFDPHALYPGPGDGPQPDVTILTESVQSAFARRGDEIRVVAGHFPLCTTELLGGEFRTFTVLRDPVERTLSALRHHRELTPAASGMSLDELYEDPMQQLTIHNHMVKMLSLTTDEMTGGFLTRIEFTPERLVRAKAALDGIEIVGVQERFEPFCDALAARFGWQLGEPQFANRTQPAPASERLRARIASDQADDMALYEYGQSLAV